MHTVSTIDKRPENKHEGQLEYLETLELHRSLQKSKQPPTLSCHMEEQPSLKLPAFLRGNHFEGSLQGLNDRNSVPLITK